MLFSCILGIVLITMFFLGIGHIIESFTEDYFCCKFYKNMNVPEIGEPDLPKFSIEEYVSKIEDTLREIESERKLSELYEDYICILWLKTDGLARLRSGKLEWVRKLPNGMIWKAEEENYIPFPYIKEERKRRGKNGLNTTWIDAGDCFHWWMDDGILSGQISINLENNNGGGNLDYLLLQ